MPMLAATTFTVFFSARASGGAPIRARPFPEIRDLIRVSHGPPLL